MNRIRLLSEQVANQIAAGEVVERPASVVKELVENSLDAQATRLTVEIQAGGRSLIRVTDDGLGMSRDDALLCLERHATSKIARAEDLSSVATMGFRGEALPSIASVSRFTLTTRERGSESPEGTQIIVNGGKIASVKAHGSAPGTSVEARQLFFNLPARRKFLRAEETESAHIQHYVMVAALAFPAVAFEFFKDARAVWQLPAVKTADKFGALRERLRALTGSDEKLLPVDFSVELPEIATDEEETAAPAPSAARFAVWGFIGAPGVSRATREDQRVFVNRRPVENRGINFALLEGYHTALMKGRYPVCCLFIEINPGEVDVNIHPSKREIKFHREKTVRQLVSHAVRETLLKFHAAPVLLKPEPLPLAVAPRPEPADLPDFPRLSKPVVNWPAPAPSPPVAQPPPTPPLPPVAPAPLPAITPPPALLQVPLRLVGVVGRLYVVLESDRGLVLLDQHAAHERILFEQMVRRLEGSGSAPSQRLLLPETVELNARDAQFLREQLPVLTRLGVGLAEFGERTFLLDALPPFVSVSNPRRFILELVDELKAVGQSVNTLRLGEHVIAKTVCRHSVKANDLLTGPELENLVEDLRHCAMPYTCPHGRPTLIEMNFQELEKKFGRSQ
ncbi:MAG TPA: DNA mismatch repair endonuclease MutL [Verrucomicrobiae bacterium]|jgi:DNA mismatch repair protein MutL|nr:DNA mismatch repair endonuclease MutL [Verrucomicrobiae bacterium]